jgi:hypothetical protein
MAHGDIRRWEYRVRIAAMYGPGWPDRIEWVTKGPGDQERLERWRREHDVVEVTLVHRALDF